MEKEDLAHAAAQPRQRQLPRREQQRRVGEHERVQGGRARAAQARPPVRGAGQGRQIRLQADRAGLAAARLQVLRPQALIRQPGGAGRSAPPARAAKSGAWRPALVHGGTPPGR